jgi:hypothetical protein
MHGYVVIQITEVSSFLENAKVNPAIGRFTDRLTYENKNCNVEESSFLRWLSVLRQFSTGE